MNECAAADRRQSTDRPTELRAWAAIVASHVKQLTELAYTYTRVENSTR